MSRDRFRLILPAVCFMLALAGGLASDHPPSPALIYSVENNAIIGRNLPHFNNRPLYVGNANAFVLTGDRPFARFCRSFRHYGALMFGIQRGKTTFWFHEAAEVQSAFRAGSMRWTIADPRVPGLAVDWEVLPFGGGVGFANRVRAQGARPGDRLVWAYGGATPATKHNLNWALDTLTMENVRRLSFVPADCKGDRFVVEPGGFTLTAPDDAAPSIILRTDTVETPHLGGAEAWKSPADLLASTAAELPVAVGSMDLAGKPEVYLSVNVVEPGQDLPQPDPVADFAAAAEHIKDLGSRMELHTPDPALDAAAGAAAHALDGVWYPPSFVHGAMLWNARYPGWRTTYGATVGGWHDRVLKQAGYYLASQIRDSKKISFALDPEKLLTKAAPDSRFYGKGRITQDHGIYNMQTQLFAQLIHAWRWTGDAELEKILRPALELHLEWMQECFDPDLDGTYESYINTWPTDSVWFSGGGTPDETSYAYKTHEAARDMARLAGDDLAAARHEAAMARIREGFFRQLWSAERGHPGLVREQGGHRRLKLDPWLYGIFLPVESGLLNEEQMLTTLRYTEWALQNDPGPGGGRRVWTSNFVPGIWSVRELWPGDNYHLAQAYFRAGLPDDGYAILKGTFLSSAFGQPGPGNLGSPQGGTDFGDCINPFARTIVEGLFGFSPDYPNGIVRVAPHFPHEWDHASIRTPDFSLAFRREEKATTLSVALTRPARVALEVPVSTRRVLTVTNNGQRVPFRLAPGFGSSILRADLPASAESTVRIETADRVPAAAPVTTDLTAGGTARISLPGLPLIAFSDPQGILENARLESGALTGTVTAKNDHATILGKVSVGDSPQWRVFKVRISDPAADAARQAASLPVPPAGARWEIIDLASSLNADIRGIHRQRYLTPRPKSISVRLGTDGYSPWTFPHWNSSPPEIHLDAVGALLDPADASTLRTPQGVPFLWPGLERNIAFTSLWDNFPDSLTVPVGRRAEAAYFLVAGSTNVMQNRIANAVLRLRYSDGTEDRLELVPPFNFWNLCPIRHRSGAPGQRLRPNYTDPIDAFAVPKPWPERVQLGENCRAILLNHRLRPGATLESVTLETLSPEVVIGLMGITLLNPAP